MMLIYLMASMFYSVSGLRTNINIYTRSDLQNMQAIEIARQNNEFIDSAINELENNIIANAKQGKTQYLIQWKGYKEQTWENEDNLTAGKTQLLRAWTVDKKRIQRQLISKEKYKNNKSVSRSKSKKRTRK
jgi:hypothetical protein